MKRKSKRVKVGRGDHPSLPPAPEIWLDLDEVRAHIEAAIDEATKMGYSQDDLAEVIGITGSHLSAIKNGRSNAGPKTARGLGMSIKKFARATGASNGRRPR